MMIINTSGTHYKRYKSLEKTGEQAYDYEKNGLLNKLMSHTIIESDNEILKSILSFFEKSMIFLMKYTKELQNFKNIHYKNR